MKDKIMDKKPLESETEQERIVRKVEEIGVFLDREGAPPLRSRVFAYLMLAEPPHKDFFEIQEFLKASKSATSNALNDLMKENIVDYVTFSGDRRRYFKINTSGWLDVMKSRVKHATIFRFLLQGVQEERAANSKHPEFDEGLAKITDFITFIGIEIEQSIARWEKNNT